MTNSNTDSLFERFAGNPPASPDEIETAQRQLKFRLPKSYIDFMLAKNGGEGFVGKTYFVLWKIDDLISMNAAYHVAEFAPGLFLFGSNGADEAFGFDIRFETCAIVSVPFVGMNLQTAKPAAPDFKAFLLALRDGSSN